MASSGWCPAASVEWLVKEAWRLENRRVLVDQLCARLLDDGVPLWRFAVFVPTLHPVLHGDAFFWKRGEPKTRYTTADIAFRDSADFRLSPLHAVDRAGHMLRWVLPAGQTAFEYPMLQELHEQGATDYVAMPLDFVAGGAAYVTAATDHSYGFTNAHLAILEDVRVALSRLGEVHATRAVAARLLDTYVGHDAGERILRGQILRGSGETIPAGIWYCDLKGFTALSDALPRDELIGLLNAYFDAMAKPVQAEGGEVLKFIGDGMLAMFPVREGAQAACEAALHAAAEAVAGMAALNRAQEAARRPQLGFGIALHIGDVMYGNVGASNRLDFTVIGPAVNYVNRLERLCRDLGLPLLLSAAFARHVEARVVSLEHHTLRGIAAAQEVFTLRD